MVNLSPHLVQPVIGISAANSTSQSAMSMMAQVRAQGGIPILLADHEKRDASADIQKIDGLVVLGNDSDIDPALYTDKYAQNDVRHLTHKATRNENASAKGAARAAYESGLLLAAMEKKMPTLAVCGGMHRLNVMTGGTLLQHVPDLVGNDHHEQNKAHLPAYTPVIPVDIVGDSTLGTVAGEINSIYRPGAPQDNAPSQKTVENSFHHQTVDEEHLNRHFRAVAFSDSYQTSEGNRRLVEAFEPAKDGKLKDWNMLAVQWHPEFGASRLAPLIIGNLVAQSREVTAQNPNRDAHHDDLQAAIESLRSNGQPSFVQNERDRRQANISIIAR